MVERPGRYQRRTVKAVRGMESRAIAKWQAQGWELVDRADSTLSSALTFQRPAPALPMRKIALLGAVVLVIAGAVTVGAILERNGDDGQSKVAKPTIGVSTKPASPPATTPSTPVQVRPIAVDDLLDKLNAPDFGGIKTGDMYKVTGELFESDAWGMGATGEYTVFLKAKGGADDLMVFVDENEATAWVDGTRVEMVIKVVEETVDGETTGGWLRAEDVDTV